MERVLRVILAIVVVLFFAGFFYVTWEAFGVVLCRQGAVSECK